MKRTLKFVLEILQIALAIFLASIGLKAFLLPNGFLDGGVTGVAILLSKLISWEISITLPLLSIPFFILGWFTVSKRILIKSIVSILVLALIIYFENFEPITDDKLLISIFGGLFLGAGIGLAIKNGSVLDGSEILGLFVNDKTGISIGVIILWFNIILFVLTGILFSLEIAMYSVLTYLVTAKTIDLILEGFEDYVGLMIITTKTKEMQQTLIDEVGHGMTVYKGVKGYGSRGKKDDIEIIHIIVNRIDSKKTYRVIDHVDQEAFITEFDVNNVKGGALKKYLTRKDSKKPSTIVFETAE